MTRTRLFWLRRLADPTGFVLVTGARLSGQTRREPLAKHYRMSCGPVTSHWRVNRGRGIVTRPPGPQHPAGDRLEVKASTEDRIREPQGPRRAAHYRRLDAVLRREMTE